MRGGAKSREYKLRRKAFSVCYIAKWGSVSVNITTVTTESAMTDLQSIIQVLKDFNFGFRTVGPQVDASQGNADVRVGRAAAQY